MRTRLAGLAGMVAMLCAVPAAVAQLAPAAPPGILKEDCTQLKGKAKAKCDARNKAGDAAPAKAAPDTSGDIPTGADADVPGEPPTSRPSTSAGVKPKPDTSDMPIGTDADPPASSMGPLKPDGTPDTQAPARPGSPGASSSSSNNDDDVAPTTEGGDSPVKAATLKDMGSHADTSAARAKLEENRVTDDVKIGRYYLKDGNFAGAASRFKDALLHDPDDPDAHFAMAELLLKQKRNSEAAVYLKRYLELAPDDDHTKEAQKLLAKLSR